jgi:hypothetical protein
VHEDTSQIELNLEPDVDISPIDSARRQRVSKPRERRVAHVGLHQRVNRRFYPWLAYGNIRGEGIFLSLFLTGNLAHSQEFGLDPTVGRLSTS